LILLFAKIFTYLYVYSTISFLTILVLATVYSIIGFEVQGFEGYFILGLALLLTILVRKSIKQFVIGLSSGYMLGIGVAAIGFKHIFEMGWNYILDSIYFPSLVILVFTVTGISYQYYLRKSEESETPSLSKKQTNTYFGAGSAVVALILIVMPLLVTPEKSELETSFDELIEAAQSDELNESIEELKKVTTENNLGESLEKLDKAGKDLGQTSEEALKELEKLSKDLEALSDNFEGETEIKRSKTATILVPKANFYEDDLSTKRKAYLIKGQEITYSKAREGFVFASYTNSGGKTTKGWMNSADLSGSKTILFSINDPDGYSNLRKTPGGDILQKVYDTEKFEVIGTESKHKKVKLQDGTIGFIHESRVKQIN
jgi:hypothetical protein